MWLTAPILEPTKNMSAIVPDRSWRPLELDARGDSANGGSPLNHSTLREPLAQRRVVSRGSLPTQVRDPLATPLAASGR